MNYLIKFSGEFFTPKDELTNEGMQFVQSLKENNITSGYFVIGGGNRMRGKNSEYERNASDKMGVISTILNGMILQENLRNLGLDSTLFSHFQDFGRNYNPKCAKTAFANNRFVILTSGLGKVGYVSTDLSSVIKSLELGVDAMIKVTKVDGIYDKNPSQSDAKLIKQISHEEVMKNNLNVIDLPAIAIAHENNLPIGITNTQNFINFINKQDTGSIIGKNFL